MNEVRLFVGNIPPNTSETELSSEFGYYGTVSSVELKQKSEDNFYGFVNIKIDEKLVEKCIREFGQQKFKGNFLSVSRAKESFLDRLKKERQGQERLGDDDSIGRRLIEISMKSSAELEETNQVAKLPQIQKEVSSDESSSEEEEPVVEQPKFQAKKISFDTSYSYKKEEPKILDKAVLDDMKRIQSLQKLKDTHREQKNAIRNALMSIDSTAPRTNKIVFEKPEPVLKEKEKKSTLFDDNEDEIEIKQDSFKLKKQFEGKKGEKLFELQTKFHNDSRFKMDEKFVDETDEFVDSRKKYAREELKERKRLRKEMANWDQDELKEERDHQLSILESITGQPIASYNNSTQKTPQKGMVRFDPSKKTHQKYLDVVRGDEIIDDEEKDVKMDVDSEDDEKNKDEKYFQVSDGLADAFKSQSQPFSIFGMLGINQDNNDDEIDEKVEEPVEVKAVKLPSKIQAIQMNQARFKYDSSDTDSEAEKEKTKKTKKEPQKKSKDGKYTKTGVWRYNFFVCDGDKRLNEAFAFLKKTNFIEPETLHENRKKLKKVIKSQVRKARHDKEMKTSKKRKV